MRPATSGSVPVLACPTRTLRRAGLLPAREAASQLRAANRPPSPGKELLGHLLPLLQVFAQKLPVRFEVNAIGAPSPQLL